MNKEIWISLIVIVVLVTIFSSIPFVELTPRGGSGTEVPGDSGMVLPGKGSEPAEVIMSESRCEPTVEVTTVENCLDQDQTEDEGKEISMNDMLSFWCGVVAVLIGETSVLMVAIALMKIKIKGDRNGKQG